jgi:anti-anti-sigma factor
MKVKDVGKGTVVSLENNLDSHNCSELRSQVISLVAQGKKDIIINLSGSKYMDSSGIGVLVFLSNLLKRYDRTLKLTGLQPNVMAIIKTAHLEEVWDLYESLDQAVAGLGG